ncbi:MAG: adenylate/guanylate cyclase domain-containing protein [Actinomycetota bacterium]
MTSSGEIRYAHSGDVHIAYQVTGSSEHDVLHISFGVLPIDAPWEEPNFDRYLRRIASFSRLICFDRRGVGLSDPVSPSSPPTMEQWVQDALAVLDAVSCERATVVASVEMGLVGMLLAAAHPERVKNLVLINAFAKFFREDSYPVGAPREFFEQRAEVALSPDAIEQGMDLLKMLAPSVADDPSFRTWWDRSGQRGASPALAPALLKISRETDLTSILSSIRVPTVVMHRTKARIHRVEHSRYLASHLPNAKLVELDGEDELFWIGNSDAIIDEIEELVIGTRSHHDDDRILATVLFTDIVDSTKIAASLGDRKWHDMLDAHDSMIRRQLTRFGGKEIKTTGDGFLATFQGPARAIRCATAIRDGSAQIGLSVRAGVHSGECEIRGDDVGGLAVHIGARILSLANPNEVLVSSTVKDLVVGSGITFVPRGSHELKGIPETWTLFAVE